MSALKRLYPAEAAKLDGLLDVVREHMRRSGFQVTTGIEEFQPIPRHSDWHFGRDQQGPIVHAWVTWVSQAIGVVSGLHAAPSVQPDSESSLTMSQEDLILLQRRLLL